MRIRRSDVVVVLALVAAAIIAFVVITRMAAGSSAPAEQAQSHAVSSSTTTTPMQAVTALADADEHGLPIKRYVELVYQIDPNGATPIAGRMDGLKKLVADDRLGDVKKDIEVRDDVSRQRNLPPGKAAATSVQWGDEGDGRALTFVTITYTLPSRTVDGERRKISWQQVVGKGWVVTADEPAT